MANVKIKPIGDRVLVEHIEEKEQVRGGIIIPDSVTSMSTYVFCFDIGLTNAVLGNGLTSVPFATFAYTSLSSVTFGTNITWIATAAFCYCG